MQASRSVLARICMVMNVDGEFSESIKVETEFGREFEITVEYSWNPRQV